MFHFELLILKKIVTVNEFKYVLFDWKEFYFVGSMQNK